MTISEIKASTKDWLTAVDVAPVLKCDLNYIRWQAHADPKKLGFEVTVMKRRVKINRKSFLEYLRESA